MRMLKPPSKAPIDGGGPCSSNSMETVSMLDEQPQLQRVVLCCFAERDVDAIVAAN